MIESLLVFVLILLPMFDVILLSSFFLFFFNFRQECVVPRDNCQINLPTITETVQKVIVHGDKHNNVQILPTYYNH